MSKSGFSTLNRWLGRKNKDKSMSNGKLSKSTTNLSVSSTNINETSQLEYNRITPLPAATTNAPFEQTFRITVLLPKDQLYVTRLGARIPLSKLLELVCDNKLLDAEKYEFRNPVDASQVYSCDLTIGAVGLSEVRLCHKTDSYDNFNPDEIIKLHRTSHNRESLSSSEFSSRNSKHTMKTTSPYSSSNSLNSMDSSGVNYSRIPVGGLPKLPPTTQPKMAAPPRKKRTAPRPPSQIAIPEKTALIIENGERNLKSMKAQESPLANKDFSVSTPNLTSSTMLQSDINGNDCNGHHMEDYNGSSGNGSITSNGYNDDTVLYAQIQKKNALNLQDNQHNNNDEGGNFPEPSPRKKIVPVIKKKTTAPPAPPPRNSLYMEDTQSLASTDTTSMPTTPVARQNTTEDFKEQTQSQEKPAKLMTRIETTEHMDLPTPQPRITTTTLLNATDIENDLKSFESDSESSHLKVNVNVSKVLLNRTPTPEPRSLSCEPSDMEVSYESHMQHFKREITEDDCVSKQADSGIGEPVPSPIPDSMRCEVSTLDVKSNFESSSDDDDMVKVYNFKLGKTLMKPLNETKTLEELTLMNSNHDETDSELGTPLTQAATPNTLSETSSWNFGIPISPPPTFADHKFMDNLEEDSKNDVPITPKIKERPVLNFESFKQEQQPKEKPVLTPSTPLENIVDELSSIIQEGGVETLIKKPEEPTKIEAAKPNTLSNFTINSISQTNVAKPKEVFQEKKELQETKTLYSKSSSSKETKVAESNNKEGSFLFPKMEVKVNEKPSSGLASPQSSPSSTPDEEKLYRKRNSVTSLKQRRSITRSDSFHTTAIASESVGLTKRTSSQMSLDQMNGNLNRRRSSSELSIGESPSLQSLEIIKTILNSRKNSLANSSGDEDKTVEVQARRPSDEVKFASLELKTTKFGERLDTERNYEKELQAQKDLNEQKEFNYQKELKAQEELNHQKELNYQKELKAQKELYQQNELKAQKELSQQKELYQQKELKALEELKAQKELNHQKELKALEELKAQEEINRQKELEAQEEITNQKELKAQEALKQAEAFKHETKKVVQEELNEDNLRPEKPKELPKVYRYSGPPSINFSTWNERPKVQIQAIKNEGDYIFGGQTNQNDSNKTIPRNYRMSTPAFLNEEKINKAPPVAPKPAIIQRMGIPEKEYKVPVVVKPIKDVIIENVIEKKEDIKEDTKEVLTPVTKPSVTATTKPLMNGDIKPINTARPTVEAVLRPQTQFIKNTSTLPRSNKQRFSTPANLPGPQLLRSSSIKQEDKQKVANSPVEDEPLAAPAPFGQNTLRRTGFKEKILAKEEQEKQKAIQTSQTISKQTLPLSNGDLRLTQQSNNNNNHVTQTQQNTITSAKLHLNLKKTTTINTNTTTPSPITPTYLLNTNLKPIPKPQTPKTPTIVSKSSVNATTTATTPPPPPPMMAKQLRPVSIVRTPTNVTEDPRDQLLAAIRNFKVDHLKKA